MSKQATLRMRMSARDAHYGGNLVPGARILEIFGDLITDLAIQQDGDEGLFRAYQSVEPISAIPQPTFSKTPSSSARPRERPWSLPI